MQPRPVSPAGEGAPDAGSSSSAAGKRAPDARSSSPASAPGTVARRPRGRPRETSTGRPGRIDWLGNLAFAAGAGMRLAGITYGIQPCSDSATGGGNPWVPADLIGGVAPLLAFCVVETRVAEPIFDLAPFQVRDFAAGNLTAIARRAAVHAHLDSVRSGAGPPMSARRALRGSAHRTHLQREAGTLGSIRRRAEAGADTAGHDRAGGCPVVGPLPGSPEGQNLCGRPCAGSDYEGRRRGGAEEDVAALVAAGGQGPAPRLLRDGVPDTPEPHGGTAGPVAVSLSPNCSFARSRASVWCADR